MFGIASSKNRGHKMTSEIEFYSEGCRLANVVNGKRRKSKQPNTKEVPNQKLYAALMDEAIKVWHFWALEMGT